MPRAELKRPFVLIGLFAALCFLTAAGPDVSLEEARRIPVQHNGRVKPFEAFARQTVKLVTGRESWDKKPAAAALLEGLADPAKIASEPWIRVDYPDLKRRLGLDAARLYFSYDELKAAEAEVQKLVRASQEKRDKDERPGKTEQKAELLFRQMKTVEGLIDGSLVKVVPSPSGGAWASPTEAPAMGDEFHAMTRLFASGDRAGFRHAAERWTERVVEAGRVARWKLELETRYFEWKPFEWAAAFYFLGALILSGVEAAGIAPALGLACVGAGFLFHTAGLAARVAVLGRPPVSNMYESMVYMNWALMLFAWVFYAFRRDGAALKAGAVLSGLIMVYANLLPLDSSLDVLVPVLRSNYWLSIHVMTIVSSYGAFGLAMALGHRHLFLWSRGALTKRASADSANLTYKVMQLGVLLIGTGTFLGGVWANESWGRFWGWDPKETWALITFLGYLIVVHLRHMQKIGDFGTALSSVLGFQLVLMTWYGVNFVLGRGLHSYGAGSGGMQWVVYFLVFEALFLGFVFSRRKT